MRKLTLFFIIGLLVIVGVLPSLAQLNDTLHVRVAHWSPDAPAVDIYIDGEVAIEALEFTSITNWMELDDGVYEIAVAPTGTSIDDAVIGPASFDLVRSTWITIAAVGSADAGTLAYNVLIEDYGYIKADFTRISITHAIPGAPPFSLLVDDVLLVSSLAYPGTKGNNDGFTVKDIPPDIVDLSVIVTNDPTVVITELTAVEIALDMNYLIAAVGTVDDPQLLVIPSSFDGDMSMMEMDAMSAGAGGGEVTDMDAEDMSDENADMDAEDMSDDDADMDAEDMSDEDADMNAEDISDEDADMDAEDMSDEDADMNAEDMSDDDADMDAEDMSDDDADMDAEDISDDDADMNAEDMGNSIADIVIAASEADEPEFTILLEAITAADDSVLELLGDPDATLTVFAPTDEAFTTFLESIEMDVETFLSDADLVTSALSYHVIEDALMVETILTLDGESVATLSGENAMIAITLTDDGVVLNDSVNIIDTDIEAANGVIHVIDSVLAP